MRNLKKVLALVLALTMVFTLFAGAIGGTYTDKEQFKTEVGAEAAQILSSLGVINGFPDGTFKPNQSVTRAELAKMIYVLKTGNNDDVPFYDDVDMSRIFSDVYKGHWASKYINYCHLNGIIVGYGNGLFKPEQAVSATEAAKMILVALGYAPKTKGLEGTAYPTNTIKLAQKNGILKNVFGNVNNAANRENAAIMLGNALFADTVMYVGGVAVPRTTTLTSLDTITLAEEGFKLLDVRGILVANDEASLGAYHTDAVNNNKTPYKNYSIAAKGTSNFVFKDYTANSNGSYEHKVLNVKFDASFDKLGSEYRLLVTKPDANNQSVTIYGNPINTANNEVNVTGSTAVKRDTVEKMYGFAKNNDTKVDKTVFLNGKAVSYAEVRNALANNTNATVRVVSNDGNNNSIEYIFATTQTIGMVVEVNEANVVINGDGMGKIENAKLNVTGEKLVKGDYVVASKNSANDIWSVKKLEKITGTVTAYNNEKDSYRIGDNYYKKSAIMPQDDSALMGNGINTIGGTALTYYVDVDGDNRFIVRAEMNENTSYSQYGLFLWSDVDNKPYQYNTIKFMNQSNAIEYRKVATINGYSATSSELTNLFTEGSVFGYIIDDNGLIHLTTPSSINESSNLVFDRNSNTFNDVNAAYAPYKHSNGTIFVTYGQPSGNSQEQFKWKAFRSGEFKTALANVNEAKVASNLLTSVEPNIMMPDRIKSSVINGVRNIEVASLSFDDFAKFGYLLPGLSVNENTETLATILGSSMALENGKYVYTFTYAGINSTDTHTIQTIGFAAPIAGVKTGSVYKLTVNSDKLVTAMSEYKVNSASNNDGIEKEAYTVDSIYKTFEGKYQLNVKKLVANNAKPYYDTINVTIDPAKTAIYFVNGMFTGNPTMWDKNKLPVAGTSMKNEDLRVWLDLNESNNEIYNIWIDSKPAAKFKNVALSGIKPLTVDFNSEGKFTYGFEERSSIASTFSTLVPVNSLVAFGTEHGKFALTEGEAYKMLVNGIEVIDILD